jgi:hypothetical protein
MSEPQNLTEHQKESRKEIVIPITLSGLLKGYSKIAYDFPVDMFKKLTRAIDDASIHPRMRTGFGAVVTMPLGIMTRNGSRAAHNLADGRYAHSSHVLGAVGAAAAWWVAGQAAFASMAASSLFGFTGGTAVAATLAAVGTGFAVVPLAFTVGTLASAVAIGVGITALSSIPALVNLKTGFLRTMDRVKGIKGVEYDGKKELEEISYNSLSARHERKEYNELSYRLRYLSDDHQKEIFDGLKEKFDSAAAANQNQPQAQPAPVAVPAAAPKAPTP